MALTRVSCVYMPGKCSLGEPAGAVLTLQPCFRLRHCPALSRIGPAVPAWTAPAAQCAAPPAARSHRPLRRRAEAQGFQLGAHALVRGRPLAPGQHLALRHVLHATARTPACNLVCPQHSSCLRLQEKFDSGRCAVRCNKRTPSKAGFHVQQRRSHDGRGSASAPGPRPRAHVIARAAADQGLKCVRRQSSEQTSCR